jgi:hypothetical protein
MRRCQTHTHTHCVVAKHTHTHTHTERQRRTTTRPMRFTRQAVRVSVLPKSFAVSEFGRALSLRVCTAVPYVDVSRVADKFAAFEVGFASNAERRVEADSANSQAAEAALNARQSSSSSLRRPLGTSSVTTSMFRPLLVRCLHACVVRTLIGQRSVSRVAAVYSRRRRRSLRSRNGTYGLLVSCVAFVVGTEHNITPITLNEKATQSAVTSFSTPRQLLQAQVRSFDKHVCCWSDSLRLRFVRS